MTALIYNPITYVLAWCWIPFWIFFPGLGVAHRLTPAAARKVQWGGIITGTVFALVIPVLYP